MHGGLHLLWNLPGHGHGPGRRSCTLQQSTVMWSMISYTSVQVHLPLTRGSQATPAAIMQTASFHTQLFSVQRCVRSQRSMPRLQQAAVQVQCISGPA